MNVTREMPKYECHKKVWALKIKHICLADNNEGAELTPEEDAYAPFFVSQEYMDKHKPEVGGYYVVYEDGYKSFSPAGAFESGYTHEEGQPLVRQDVLMAEAKEKGEKK